MYIDRSYVYPDHRCIGNHSIKKHIFNGSSRRVLRRCSTTSNGFSMSLNSGGSGFSFRYNSKYACILSLPKVSIYIKTSHCPGLLLSWLLRLVLLRLFARLRLVGGADGFRNRARLTTLGQLFLSLGFCLRFLNSWQCSCRCFTWLLGQQLLELVFNEALSLTKIIINCLQIWYLRDVTFLGSLRLSLCTTFGSITCMSD